jgi:hypothetical protein
MPNEKSISDMNSAELRAALDEYARAGLPAPAPAPLPPGITPDMSQKSQETASQLFGEAIMRKPASALTQGEKDFLKASIAAWSRESQ